MTEKEGSVPTNEELDFGKKKKKSKKAKEELFKEEKSTETTTEGASANNEAVVATSENAQQQQEEETIDFGTKKKGRKGRVIIDEDQNVEIEIPNKEEAAESRQKSAAENSAQLTAADYSCDWQGSERDYTYDELLTRVFNIMREKNPDMITGEKKKFVMKPPQVARVGTKKTSFSNFADICKLLRRQEKHLLNFLLAELGTSGSLDINKQLTIKGRFQQKQIENVLRRYIKEYVTCHTCRSPDTVMVKEERLFFLKCEACGATCSVASIKSGFQAQVGRRAAIRARTT